MWGHGKIGALLGGKGNLRMRVHRRGFTLIELLIVIAIIAILALIAVPNFLEAQMRAKVARSMADMRTTATGLEAYAVDWGRYPPGRFNDVDGWQRPLSQRLRPLTTPVAYLGSVPRDDFRVQQHGNSTDPGRIAEDDTFDYITFTDIKDGTGNPPWSLHKRKWRLSSAGPDMIQQWSGQGSVYAPYDPSNGTISRGDVIHASDIPAPQ